MTSTTPKTALVLSGGSIKGCWQAGAINYVVNTIGLPDIVYGISVGSLNATLLTQLQSGNGVAAFWMTNITSPSTIIRKRSWAELIWKTLRGKFDGYLDTTPLRKLLEKFVDVRKLKESTVRLMVGFTGINTGTIAFSHPCAQWIDLLMASAAIPVAMPGVRMKTDWLEDDVYFDGGLRDIAPLAIAIQAGCTEIVVIVCSPRYGDYGPIKVGNPLQLILRSVDILTNEVLNNDLDTCIHINDNIDQYPGKVKIKLTIIRPDMPLDINIEDFTYTQILAMLADGFRKAAEIITTRTKS
jgi:NTE family protein